MMFHIFVNFLIALFSYWKVKDKDFYFLNKGQVSFEEGNRKG